MAVYSIKDLESLSGIKAHTIRIWEKRYNLIKPHRTSTNIRYYTDKDLKKILNIALLNRHGIKISNIAKLNDLELKDEIMRLAASTDSRQNIIDSMIMAMVELDEIRFLAILNKSISKIGFKEAIIQVVYPFLNKTGVLWQAGDISPAQEHFVSNLIRQKILTAIDGFPHHYNPESKRFILLLPEGEWHEIGLLFCFYLIREAGHEAIYLGQSVPYSDLLATGATKNFDYILLSSTTPRPEFNFQGYLEDLGVAFPDKSILYYSYVLKEKPVELGSHHVHLNDLKAFVRFLENLKQE